MAIPAIMGFYLKVKSKVHEVNRRHNERATAVYDKWKHERSCLTIAKVKETCNVYKDKSAADQVFFLQLENGTVASSKLDNMFFSCLAEDDRYSEIPKKQLKLQRVPYAQFAEWLQESSDKVYVNSEISPVDSAWLNSVAFDNIYSVLSTVVRDKDGYAIGLAVLGYGSPRLNCANEVKQFELVKEFKTAIETTFLSYYVECRDKRKELELSEGVA